MAKIRRSIAGLVTLIMIICIIPFSVFAEDPENGWVNEGTKEDPYWVYYKDGELVKDQWLKDGKKWYYLDEYGGMVAGRSVVDGKKAYLLGEDGAMVTKKGWVGIKDTYDIEPKAALKLPVGETKTYTTWYYLKSGGVCTTGWKKISGKWYYFYPILEEAEYYYGIGCMVDVPSHPIGDKVYAFYNSGAMVTKTGWVSISYEGTKYWFYLKKDGVCTIGWKKIGGKWYYFEEYGPMVHDTTINIDGLYYEFDSNGVCINPDGSAPAT